MTCSLMCIITAKINLEKSKASLFALMKCFENSNIPYLGDTDVYDLYFKA